MQAFVIEGEVEDLVHELEAGRPAIVGTAKPTITGEHVAHYEVVVGVHAASQRIATLDPAAGLRQNSYSGFFEEWLPTGRVLLVVLPVGGSQSEQLRGTDAAAQAGTEPVPEGRTSAE